MMLAIGFVTSYIWQLPFGKGRQHLIRGGVADAILGGWVFLWDSYFPVRLPRERALRDGLL